MTKCQVDSEQALVFQSYQISRVGKEQPRIESGTTLIPPKKRQAKAENGPNLDLEIQDDTRYS